MDFDGSAMAQAEFLRLRTQAAGSVHNSYFNPDNDPIWDMDDNYNPDGSPQSMQVAASAEFTDTLQFGGTASGYGARYQFAITGNLAGEDAFHLLGVTIAGNYEQFRTAPGQTGAVLEFYGTESYPISGPGQEVKVRVFSSFATSPEFYADGSSIDGEADFFNTVVLERVEVIDADGNVVPPIEWTVTSASGTTYPVPEPGTCLPLLGALLLIAVTKRRQSAARTMG